MQSHGGIVTKPSVVRLADYPGWRGALFMPTPTGLWQDDYARPQPRWGWTFVSMFSQASRFAASLGYMPQPPWGNQSM